MDPAADSEMVQCEITGAWVPADETVEFRGRRVSAAGKQILFERLQAGESLPGEVEIAGRWIRLGCGIVDSILMGAVGFGILIVFVGGSFLALLSGSSPSLTSGSRFVLMQAAGTVAATLVQFGYYAWMHARFGRTLGKMAGRLRVVQENLQPITRRQAVGRSALYTMPNLLGVAALLLGLVPQVAEHAVLIGGVLNVAVSVFVITNLLFIVFTVKRRAIHDLAAGTVVVRDPS